MRSVLVCSILVVFLTTALGQTILKSPTLNSKSSIPIERWDLDRFVWSQTHYKTGENDKPVLDFDAIDHWYGIGHDNDVSISADGNYFAYMIVNKPYKGNTLVVQSMDKDHSWSQSFFNAKPGFFSPDGKQYIFQNETDALCFLKIGRGNEIEVIKDVSSFQVSKKGNGKWLGCLQNNAKSSLILLNLLNGEKFQLDGITSFKFDLLDEKVILTDKAGFILFDLKKGKGKAFKGVSKYTFDKSGKWLACQIKSDKSSNDPADLLIYNLVSDVEQRYSSVNDYLFDPSGNGLLLKIMENGINNSLLHINLLKNKLSTIWMSYSKLAEITNFSFDVSGNQVVFSVSNSDSSFDKTRINSIWYWKQGMERGKLLVDKNSPGIEEGMLLQGNCLFNGNYIFFSVQKPVPKFSTMPDPVLVDIWNYKDTLLQSTQQHHAGIPKAYSACIYPAGGKVIVLNSAYEIVRGIGGNYALVESDLDAKYGDRFWEKDPIKDSIWLVNLQSGNRELLTAGGTINLWLAPGGRYEVYFDASKNCQYYSLDLQTGKSVSISSGVPACQLGLEDHSSRNFDKNKSAGRIAAWLQDEAGILVYDNYDIWRLDLAGKKPPINITNGYGRLHEIVFSISGNGEDGQFTLVGIPILKPQTSVLLKSFNRVNKQYGVYQKVLGSSRDPELLYAGDFELSLLPVTKDEISSFLASWAPKPVKAKQAKKWIVKRQSAIEAPNYFSTSDFKTYQRLTNLQPQQTYNWITSELHEFRQLDGTTSQGILYKPENFDSTKKYPVLINFYGTLTQLLNHYPLPEYLTCPSFFESPAWLVSHGYMVFLPDVYFMPRQWGPSALNTIEGAAQYLRKLSYVDSGRLAACGHSNSGRLGYYVLTHSHSFAAMSVGSGTTDLINTALSLNQGQSFLKWAESGSFGGGLGPLWENKQSWLDQSSVLHVDQVTSPLLLFHNKADAVPVNQAEEMFISLQRLGKPVWWLQYDNGSHTLEELNDSKDFTIRATQFFDHYLKGAPAPKWMTEGIPFQLKGSTSRYDLDMEGVCGKDCKVCRKLATSVQ